MTLLLALAVLGQTLSFNSDGGFAEVIGTREQQIRFFQEWREDVHPRWKTENREWWDKQYDSFIDRSRYQNLLFRSDRNTRVGLARTIVYRGYWVRFRLILHPFGGIWIYYNVWYHAMATIVGLLLVIWWMRRKKRVNNQLQTAEV